MQYNPDVYDASGLIIPEDNFQYLSLDIQDCSQLIVVEETTRLNEGTILDVINDRDHIFDE